MHLSPPRSFDKPEGPPRYHLGNHEDAQALFRNDVLVSTDIRDIRRDHGYVIITYTPIARHITMNTVTLASTGIPASVVAHAIPVKLFSMRQTPRSRAKQVTS